MKADIHAEHGSVARCSISEETQATLTDIIGALERLSLPDDLSSSDDITESICGLPSLSCNELIDRMETWTQMEESTELN